VGGGALGARVSALLGRQVTVAEAFELADSDNPVKDLLDHALDTLAVDIANVAITLDLERIAVGGGLIHHCEWLPRLDNVLRRAVPFPPDLVIARFSQDAPLVGAVVTPWTAPDNTGGTQPPTPVTHRSPRRINDRRATPLVHGQRDGRTA